MLCWRPLTRLKNRGIDVVVGYIERHTRPDTLALLEGLEQLPEKIVEYKESPLKELDLDAALQRRPNILLVDELAIAMLPGAAIQNDIRMWRNCCEPVSVCTPPLMFSIWNP